MRQHLALVVGHGADQGHLPGLGGQRQQRSHAFDRVVLEQHKGLVGHLAGRGAALGRSVVGRTLSAV
jgi:hypothetical protein